MVKLQGESAVARQGHRIAATHRLASVHVVPCCQRRQVRGLGVRTANVARHLLAVHKPEIVVRRARVRHYRDGVCSVQDTSEAKHDKNER